MWKYPTFSRDVFVLVVLVLIRLFQFFTGPARICDVKSVTLVTWQRSRPVFFNFFIYFLRSFRLFRWFRSFRWFRFGCFVSLFRILVHAVTKTRPLGMTVDHKHTRTSHVMDIKTFVTKKDLLKRSRFLPTKVLRHLYFKVILPSVKYGLVLWGACCDSDLFHSI